MNNQTDKNQLETVLEIINRLAKESVSGDYIYRGEPKCYEKVSSRLYREECKDIKVDGFDIEVVQQEILKDAKQYTTLTDKLEILSELQHYGGNTNLIDFTTDYLIALFFACNSLLGKDGKDGRVILLENTGESINQPRNPLNRIIAQKSRFIRPKQGFIEPKKYKVIKISKELKPHILTHLRKSHGISTETIYNDLHGFIRNRSIHQSAYIEFYRAFTYQDKGDNDEAIKHYTEAIRLNPNLVEAYNNRGLAYYRKDDYDQAIQDYSKAIDLNPNYAKAHYSRGIVYYRKGELDEAFQDFTRAIELQPDFTDAYYNRGVAYSSKGEFDEAIRDYNQAIALNPDHAEAYNNRGAAYDKKGNFDKAAEDYNQAITLQPDNAVAYFNQGTVWLRKQAWDAAKSDLKAAKEKGADIAELFSNDYGSVSAFEERYHIQLPADIRDMLTA